MESFKKRTLFVALFLIMFITSGCVSVYESSDFKEFLPALNQAVLLYEKKHRIEVTSKQKEELKEGMRGALNNELKKLGPHSRWHSPEEAKEIMKNAKGEFEGIGSEISIHPDDRKKTRKAWKEFMKKHGSAQLSDPGIKKEAVRLLKALRTITSRGLYLNPFEDSPAKRAGAMKGDLVLEVDSKPLEGLTIIDAVKLIRGKSGTKVSLLIKRGNNPDPKLIEVTRGKVTIKSVKSRLLKKNIGYLKISDFETKTPDQFKKQLLELKDNGIKSLIIDVRGNPGGRYMSVDTILEFIVPEGHVFLNVERRGVVQKFSESSSDFEKIFKGGRKRIVVLTDRGSASASEILTGVLKYYELATIIGERTYGKGTIQTVSPLFDGSLLRMTTAEYILPSGDKINNKGIEPHIKMKDKPETDKDEILEIAVEFLLNK